MRLTREYAPLQTASRARDARSRVLLSPPHPTPPHPPFVANFVYAADEDAPASRRRCGLRYCENVAPSVVHAYLLRYVHRWTGRAKPGRARLGWTRSGATPSDTKAGNRIAPVAPISRESPRFDDFFVALSRIGYA